MHLPLYTVILLFALLGHGYLWIGIVNRLHGWSGPHRLIDVLTLASLLSFLALPMVVAWQSWQHGSHLLNEQSLPIAAQLSQFYSLATAFWGFGRLVAKFVRGWHEDDRKAMVWKERKFVEPSQPLGGKVLKGYYSQLFSFVPGNQVLRLAVDVKQLVIPRLPPELAGLRIVHFSDLHMTGRIGPQWFMHVAETVQSLDADAIMITGDLIENESCRSSLKECLSRLRAKHGVYFVLGNHDYYIDAEQTIADLTELGLEYVGERCLQVEWNDYPVLIAGNEAPWRAQLADPTNSGPSLGDRPFRILLMHTPDQFDWACRVHGDLALAGHTHGGQVCFPILGAVAAPSLYGTRFAGGTFRRGNTVMHVTRGISGETPMRWLCPPEIAVLELVPAKS